MQRDPNGPRLPDPPEGSDSVAAPGWVEQIGWGLDRHIAAITADASMAAVAGGKRKPPTIPRPKEKQVGGKSLSSQIDAMFTAFEKSRTT